jgi:hypothetical protein
VLLGSGSDRTPAINYTILILDFSNPSVLRLLLDLSPQLSKGSDTFEIGYEPDKKTQASCMSR